MWQVFRKYHYLNTDLHKGAEQYVGVWNGHLVCHTGVLQAPMIKKTKRVHRLVVLPDYQGIGIGMAFIGAIAEIYKKRGIAFRCITTTPQMVNALRKSTKWRCTFFGRQVSAYKGFAHDEKNGHLVNNTSAKRMTYTFVYK